MVGIDGLQDPRIAVKGKEENEKFISLITDINVSPIGLINTLT